MAGEMITVYNTLTSSEGFLVDLSVDNKVKHEVGEWHGTNGSSSKSCIDI